MKYTHRLRNLKIAALLVRSTQGNDFVIEHFQKTCWNLGAPFRTIAKRAGLGTVIRPFDNVRMSRSTEVDRKYGSKKESLWIGHSERVMMKH
jgi:hypothetical protein